MKLSVPILGVIILAGVYGCGSGDKAKTEAAPGKPELTKLNIIDSKVGTGVALESGDSGSFIYTGKLANGKVFDSNVGKDPISFAVGIRQVIVGWDEGLIGMKEGGKRTLEIPWAKGYGEQGSGEKIPPKSDLYFDIELVKVSKKSDSGKILVDVVKDGVGPTIKDGDVVTINYVVKSDAGKVLQDSKVDKDKDDRVLGPLTFTVGNIKQVIKGVNAAVKSMKPGGAYTVTLPMGWGPERMSESATPGQSVIVDIQVVKVIAK